MPPQDVVDAIAKLLAHLDEQDACKKDSGRPYDNDAVSMGWPSYTDDATVEAQLGGRVVDGRLLYLVR